MTAHPSEDIPVVSRDVTELYFLPLRKRFERLVQVCRDTYPSVTWGFNGKSGASPNNPSFLVTVEHLDSLKFHTAQHDAPLKLRERYQFVGEGDCVQVNAAFKATFNGDLLGTDRKLGMSGSIGFDLKTAWMHVNIVPEGLRDHLFAVSKVMPQFSVPLLAHAIHHYCRSPAVMGP
jgi:hypothetical protein